MNRIIKQSIEDIKQLNHRMLRNLGKFPDDRLNWSPSSTARTPLQIVAHCGFSLGFITTMLNGTPYPTPTMAEADAEFLAMESTIKTREEALARWALGLDAFVAHLEQIKDDDLDKMVKLPFGMGELPLSYMVGVGSMHTREHLGQIEYLQTIYGDREW